MRSLLVLSGLVLSAGDALAVPAFLQLYKQRFGVKLASCAVCHAGGAGGKLNDFGRDFVRAGGNWAALDAIARRDSDGDGASNEAEAAAGSNPGDPASTPARPGNWLVNVKLEDQVPLDDLGELFPKAGRFEAADYELSDADAEAIGKALGAPLSREDRVGTLYFPVDTKAATPVRTGVAVFTATSQDDGVLLASVTLDAAGKILKASAGLFGATGRDSLKELARQLPGRTLDGPLVLGKTLKPMKGRRKLSEQGVQAFRKALLIVQRRLGAPR